MKAVHWKKPLQHLLRNKRLNRVDSTEYIKVTDMMNQIDVLRASASMPYVAKIVEYQGMKLLDGGCTDSIPVEQFR